MPREWHFNGFEGRGTQSLSADPETTYGSAEIPRTKINTKPDCSATPETPDSATLHAPHSATQDPDLAAIVAAWPGLPEAIRARIIGLVEGATTLPK